MQQLITLRLDVSPLIYHQQSGSLSHSSNSRELAAAHTCTGRLARMLFLERGRSPDYPELIFSCSLSLAAADVQYTDCLTDCSDCDTRQDKGLHMYIKLIFFTCSFVRD